MDADQNLIPSEWAAAFAKGWRVMRTSCGCGGNYAWFKPRPSGAYVSWGCVCHQTPTEKDLRSAD